MHSLIHKYSFKRVTQPAPDTDTRQEGQVRPGESLLNFTLTQPVLIFWVYLSLLALY